MNYLRKEFKATFASQVFFYLFAYGWILFSLYMFLYKNPTLIDRPGQIAGFLFMECMFFGVAGLMSNYCVVEGQMLLIKNHIWFWKNKEYDMKKLFSIDYVSIPKIGFSFKIKIRNGAAHIHGVNGISNSEIIELYQIFNTYKIKLTGFPEVKKESKPNT
jgi:hypothetical protein